MASLSTDKRGNRTIQFYSKSKKRKSVRLGKVPKKMAETVRLRVEQLNAAAIAGHSPGGDVSRWLSELDAKLHDKLVAVGLAESREDLNLEDVIDGFIDRKRVKGSTLITYNNVRRNLLKCFEGTLPAREMTTDHGEQFREFLLDVEKLAENTVRRRCGIAREIFHRPFAKKQVSENPFSTVPVAIIENRERDFFIERSVIEAVINACPDAQWRLIVALCRYGGLRCPSEVLALKLEHINWERDRFTVDSPKTGQRVVPIFPELRPHLQEVFELAEPGTEFMITRYRSTEKNLRTQFHKIIRRAGEEPWPKVFHNLRASRQTELVSGFNISDPVALHVACKWLGNSPAVALKHYLQPRESDFEKAVQRAAKSGAIISKTALRNPVPTQAASSRLKSTNAENTRENREESRLESTQVNTSQEKAMGDTGLEPVTSAV